VFLARANVLEITRIVQMSADPLDQVLQNFNLSVQRFHSGPLCGTAKAKLSRDGGHLHVIHQGLVEVLHEPHPVMRIVEPTVLLYPRPLAHRFRVDAAYVAQFSCATVDFTSDSQNPMLLALPDVVAIALARLPGAQGTIELLQAEASNGVGGRQALVDRLFEVLLIQVLRKVIDDGQVPIGIVRAVAHPQIGSALMALHDDLARRWSLQALADVAGISRSNFASLFRSTMGTTVGEYLVGCRLAQAQAFLRDGEPLKRVADLVGYSSAESMARVFAERLQLSPRAWLLAERANQALPAQTQTVADPACPAQLAILREANEHLVVAILEAQAENDTQDFSFNPGARAASAP